MAMPQRDDPPTPRLQPTLKLRRDKSVDRYDPPSLMRASVFALCAMADKMADKLRKSSGWWRRCNNAHA